MNRFEQLLASRNVVILDGAMGTMLMARGLKAGEAPEKMNTEHPEVVAEIHREYIKAGSNIILTNTFGGNRFRLKRHGLDNQVREINLNAARLARQVADEFGEMVVVAGDIGPTGEMMKPLGSLTFEDAKQAFAEQAAALSSGGVDVIWIETMSDINEVKAAVEGAKSVTALPIVATMSFESRGRTMMGNTPEQLVELGKQYQLSAVGANCGKGPQELETAIAKMRAFDPDITLIAKANAGIPKLIEGNLIYDGTPEVMAEHAERVSTFGVHFIGACCGSSPEHIQAMVQVLRKRE
ncbi:MAG: betaine--homocysteine S-methyltransferase [Anaerolineales bacterium]